MPFLFYVLAKIEYSICKSSLYWINFGDSAWYAYGTFLGEGITRTIDSEQAWGIRYEKSN